MRIKLHDDLESPLDDTIIWRYMELSQFLDILVNKQIYFPNMNVLSDKYEGNIPKNILEQKRAELEIKGLEGRELEEEISRFMYFTSAMPELTRINCWSMENLESYALWKIYLKGSPSGVAIRSTVGALKNSLINGNDSFPEDIYIGKVNYMNHGDSNNLSRFSLVTRKMPFYSYEKELRLMILNYPISEGGVCRKSDGKGRYVKIDINELIEQIYISPFASGWFYKTMEKTIESINPILNDRIISSQIQDS